VTSYESGKRLVVDSLLPLTTIEYRHLSFRLLFQRLP
jgi:hypothetical protein